MSDERRSDVNVNDGSDPCASIPATEIDDSDAHTIWCNCDECVEVLVVELIEDRAKIASA